MPIPDDSLLKCNVPELLVNGKASTPRLFSAARFRRRGTIFGERGLRVVELKRRARGTTPCHWNQPDGAW